MKVANRVVKPRAEIDPDRIAEWVERVAAFFAERYGLPPITGRILGWLLICEPAEQSAGEIAAAIGASRASLTTTMRFLTASGLVRRRTRPGQRTAYYRIDDDAWEKVIRQRIASMASFCAITEDAMRLLGPGNPRAGRVRAAHDMFQWMEHLLASAPPPAVRRDPLSSSLSPAGRGRGPRRIQRPPS